MSFPVKRWMLKTGSVNFFVEIAVFEDEVAVRTYREPSNDHVKAGLTSDRSLIQKGTSLALEVVGRRAHVNSFGTVGPHPLVAEFRETVFNAGVLSASLEGKLFFNYGVNCLRRSDLESGMFGAREQEAPNIFTFTIDPATGRVFAPTSNWTEGANRRSKGYRTSVVMGRQLAAMVFIPERGTPFTECSVIGLCDERYGFKSNVPGWDIREKSSKGVTDADIAELLPTIRLVRGGGSLAADEVGTVEVAVCTNSGAILHDWDGEVFLEQTGGYLPMLRVPVTNGLGRFRVMPLGLDSGDQFKVKVGFRLFSGVLDVPFVVK